MLLSAEDLGLSVKVLEERLRTLKHTNDSHAPKNCV